MRILSKIKDFLAKRGSAIKEGVIIGVISGVIIAYITDANFQASVDGPIVNIFKKVYSSKDWTNIKARRLETGQIEASATNISSGMTVTFQNMDLDELPADLRWDIETSGELK